MQAKQIAIVVAVLATNAFCVMGGTVYSSEFQPPMGETQLNTKIAVLDSKGALGDFAGDDQQAAMTVVDPGRMLDEAPQVEDVEEDPIDPFITSASGKPRALLMEDEDEFADESPLVSEQHALKRIKRCNGGGGGGGGGGNGNANRSRQSRRSRSNRRVNSSRRNNNKGGTTTTTTVRRVIHNVAPGQAVAPQPVVSVAPQQSVIVHHQPGQQVVAQPAPVAVQN